MEAEFRPTAVRIRKLVDCIQGEILNNEEQAEESVESLMIGAFCVDPTPLYFGLKKDKAVITRGDRADIQLGALDTSTKCLIVTGGVKPIPMVMERAEEKKVPVVLAQKDTLNVLADIEQCLGSLEPENLGGEDHTTTESAEG